MYKYMYYKLRFFRNDKGIIMPARCVMHGLNPNTCKRADRILNSLKFDTLPIFKSVTKENGHD